MQPQILFSLAIFLVVLPGMTLIGILTGRRRAKTEAEKRFVTLYYFTLMSTFTAGALVRTVQQITGSQRQDGFVGIFMGLFLSLVGVPFLWHAWHDQPTKHGRIRKGLALLVNFLFSTLGASLLGLGLYRIVMASN